MPLLTEIVPMAESLKAGLEHLRSDGDPGALAACQTQLRQLRAGLLLAHCWRGVVIATELLAILDAQNTGHHKVESDGYSALHEAVEALAALLQRPGSQCLEVGTLLPLVNELRAVSGVQLIVEYRELAALDQLSDSLPAVPDETLQDFVKHLRRLYQTALLGILKGYSLEANYRHLYKACERLKELTARTRLEYLWHGALVFIELLSQQSIPLSFAAKSLLKGLEREIQAMAEQGLQVFRQPFPRDLFSAMLHYIVDARPATSASESLLSIFGLDTVKEGDQSAKDRYVEQALRTLRQWQNTPRGVSAGVGPAAADHTATLMAIADDLLLAQLWFPRHGLVGIAERAAWGQGVAGSVAPEQMAAGIDDLVFVLEGALEGECTPTERDTAAPGNTEAWQRSIQGILDQLLGISRMLLGYLGSGDSSQLDHAAEQFAGLATELQNLSLPVTAEQMALCGRALLEGVIPAVVDDESAPFNEAIAGTVLAVTAYIASLLDDDNDRANRTLRLTHLMALPLREQVGALPVSARETASKIQGLDQQCSEAQDSEEQGMEPLKAPYAETVTGMDNNDGVDPEIRDIFVEEAREVLANLAEDYPRWSSAQGDHGVVQELRRAFHTLKGSGRMAGAMVLGELAWAVERLFNGILDGKLKVEPVTLSLVAEVLTLLPGLVDEFEQGLTCANPQRVTQLQKCVERLVAGQPVNEQDFRVMPAVVAPEAEPLAENAPVGLSEEDLELLEIFADEARTQLATVEEFVQIQRGKAPFYERLTPEVQRALHTLKGGARIADVQPMAAIIPPLEQFSRELLAAQLAVTDDVVELLSDGVEYSLRIIDDLLAGKDGQLAEIPLFLKRIEEQWQQLLEPLASESNEDKRIDPAFLNLLMADGMQQVLGVDQTLEAWLEGNREPALDVAAMIGDLGELSESATRAGFDAIAALANGLIQAYRQIETAGQTPGQHQVALLLEAHEALLSMIDAVAAHQQVPAAPPALIDNLADLHHHPVETVPEAQDPGALAPAAQVEESGLSVEAEASENSGYRLPDDADREVIELFMAEADELMESIEQSLLSWRESPQNTSHPEELKRALHTFKGGARMAGLAELGTRSHDFETRVVNSEGVIADGDAGAIKEMLADYDQLQVQLEAVRKAMAVREAAPVPPPVTPPLPAPATLHPVSPGREGVTWSADQVPAYAGGYTSLDKPAAQADDSSAQSAQDMVRIAAPVLETLVNLAGETSISRSQVEQNINEFEFSLDEMDVTINRMQDQVRRLSVETDAQILFRQEQIEASESKEGFDPLEMDHYSQLQQLARSLLESASDLQDLRNTLLDKSRDAEALLLRQSRIQSELQENLMRTRMVPFSRVVPRLRRIVRQVSAATGKDVVFRLDGIEGELDRSLLERIVPSLEHMIRNAIDHGIEDHATRMDKGKALEGTLSLSFVREGGDMAIRLSDDGRGLDLEAIRRRGLSRGLIREGQELSENELAQLIFLPGFSTAEGITETSGRGVGMDVVNSELRQLGGTILIDSFPGAGTTFTLRMPFTVSVNRALMIEVGSDSYGLALKSVSGVTRIPVADLREHYLDPERKFEYAGQSYEVRYLGTLLADELQPVLDITTGQVPLVLIRAEEHNYAVHVDGLIGSQEVVVKSLGLQFNRVPGLSGASVLGDGRVVVILDLLTLLRDKGQTVTYSEKVASARASQRTQVPTIMVVDDSVTVRKVTSRLLEREGFRVLTAKDGVDAMRLLQESVPDVMLLDIEMPRMDGFEVARLVRSTERLKELPIIMITSRTGDKHRDKAFAIGVNQYLGKPYQEEQLLGHIHQYLASGNRLRNAAAQ